MVNKGYIVKLIDEAGEVTTPDGRIFNTAFEQSTPLGDSATNFKNTLEHARDKPQATAAVVFMKYSKHTKQSIADGIERYQTHNTKQLRIFVNSKSGRIHRWDTHK